MRGRVLLLTVSMASAGCLSAAQVRPAPLGLVAAPPDTVPAGTLVSAQLRQPLSSTKSRSGDRFTMELLDPLTDGAGREVVGRGAVLEGVVGRTTAAEPAKPSSRLPLSIVGVESPGEGVLSLPAEVESAPVETPSGLGRYALWGLAGAAAGAGAGVGIDRQHASVVIGSTLVGLGVGALLSFVFAPRQARIPSGSILTLRLTRDWRAAHPVATAESPPPCRLPSPPPLGRRALGARIARPSAVADP